MNPFIIDLVVGAVQRQSWYRRHANTVHAGLSLLGSVLAYVATLAWAQDPRWAGGIALVIQLVGVVAVRLTRNGLQIDQAADLAAGAVAAPPTLPTAVWSDLIDPTVARHRLTA